MKFYEFNGLENRNWISRIAKGKYPKLVYEELDVRGLFEVDRDCIAEL